MKGDFEGSIYLAFDLELFEVLNVWSIGLNLMRAFEWRERNVCETYYLVVIMQTVEMMSNDPPGTWLSGRSGSSSHIAIMISTMAILVIWPITAIFAMLMTSSRHLNGVS